MLTDYQRITPNPLLWHDQCFDFVQKIATLQVSSKNSVRGEKALWQPWQWLEKSPFKSQTALTEAPWLDKGCRRCRRGKCNIWFSEICWVSKGVIVVVTQKIVPDWYTKYKMASEVSIRDARIFRALEDGPSFLKDDVEQILLPRDHLDVPMPIQAPRGCHSCQGTGRIPWQPAPHCCFE